MRETAGKATARGYFYRSYLPSVLPPRLLQSSNFLLLLGEDFHEMELLAELGVPAYRVFSVERDKQTYDRQRRLNQREEYGVALHYGELEEYLRSYRFSDHKFAVFNLDICGSNLKHIDPALGEILLFARRNPRTVVATYSSAGRDRLQLLEGLKSLAFLLWLHPEATARLVAALYEQYRSSGMLLQERSRESISKNMVLRHLFWLRSHLEHIALGSYELGTTSGSGVRRLMELQEAIWSHAAKSGRTPLRYRQLRKLADSAARHVLPKVNMDLEFSDIQIVTYTAYNGFYQCCYFATYDSAKEGLELAEWFEKSVQAMLDNPALTVNGKGELASNLYDEIAPPPSLGDMVLWEKPDLSLPTRRLAIPPLSPELAGVIWPDDEAEAEPAREPTASNGHLSDEAIAQVRRLARAGHDTQEIVERLQLDEHYRGSVTAYVAVARRGPNRTLSS